MSKKIDMTDVYLGSILACKIVEDSALEKQNKIESVLSEYSPDVVDFALAIVEAIVPLLICKLNHIKETNEKIGC